MFLRTQMYLRSIAIRISLGQRRVRPFEVTLYSLIKKDIMKTKALQTLAVLGIASMAVAGSVSAATFTLYGTGKSGTLATGATDPNFTLVPSTPLGTVTGGVTSSQGYPNLVVTKAGAPPFPSWTPDVPGHAYWISPKVTYGGTPDPVGKFIFQETFDLDPSLYNASTAVITGTWAEDNYGLGIYLNGVQEVGQVGSPTVNAYGSPSPFTISSGFQSGINTLDFVVDNTGGATGLFVNITSATASSVVPEPSTVAVYMVGSLALLGFVIRKKRIS